MSLFSIVYNDETTFEGGTVLDSKWNDIIKPIKSLTYHLGNISIYLEGYKEYNHILEITTILNSNQPFISKILLLAYDGNKVIIFKFDLIKQTFNKVIRIKDREYNKKPASGWKRGTTIQNHIYRINLNSN
jgi:hypothetical protein